jgi:predicted phage-related endonuclease
MNTKSKLFGYVYAFLIVAAMLMHKGQCNRADSAETRAATAEARVKQLGAELKAEREKVAKWIVNYDRAWKELDELRKATKELEAGR